MTRFGRTGSLRCPAVPPARTPRSTASRWAGFALGTAVLLVACGTSGRELADVPTGQTAPPRTEQAGAGPTSLGDASSSVTGTSGLTLTAADFAGGEALPVSASCDGDGVSPALTWSGVPEGTSELALTVVDADNDRAVHWAVTAILPDVTGIPRGEVPVGAIEHRNTDGEVGWASVCPPDGETHTYELTLYALPEPLALDDAATGEEVDAALGSQATAGAADVTLLVATYGR